MIIRCVAPSGHFSSGFGEDDHQGAADERLCWSAGRGGVAGAFVGGLMSRNHIFGDISVKLGKGCGARVTEVEAINQEKDERTRSGEGNGPRMNADWADSRGSDHGRWEGH
jgi:hypothetical protein